MRPNTGTTRTSRPRLRSMTADRRHRVGTFYRARRAGPLVPALHRTLDQNSRIKTFRCRKLRIHRAKEGVIHFDGDPIMAGKDLDVQVVPKALNIIVNSNKKRKIKKPESLLQIVSDYFVEVNTLRNNIQTRNKRWLELNRKLLRRKLSKK